MQPDLKKNRIKLAARILKKKNSACSQIFRGGKFVSIVEKTLKKSLKITKFATAELAKLLHSLGETELTKHWQKVRPKFGRTESSVDHYMIPTKRSSTTSISEQADNNLLVVQNPNITQIQKLG